MLWIIPVIIAIEVLFIINAIWRIILDHKKEPNAMLHSNLYAVHNKGVSLDKREIYDLSLEDLGLQGDKKDEF